MGGDSQQYATTDEEFEKATQRVIQDRETQSLPKGKRRKRKRKIQG